MSSINRLRACLPRRVCFMPSFEIGLKALLGLIIILRLTALIMGCMYGPVLYIVLPIGGLYLAADILLLYSVFKGQGGGGDKGTMQNGNLYHEQNQEEWTTSNGYAEKDDADNFAAIDETCEFPTQRIWIITWLVANVIGIIGLAIAIGLFIDLGTSNDLGFVYNLTCLEHTPLKGCTYTPLHMLQFFVILILLILLIYGQLVVISLYVMIKDAWAMGVTGSAVFSNDVDGMKPNGL